MSEQQNTKLEVMADEHDLLLDHAYDGIQELNHPLPNWWNMIFLISCVFGVGYWVYYSFMGGPSLKDEFHRDHAKIVAAQEEFKRQNSAFKQEYYDKMVAEGGLQKGAEVYELNCLPCHAENGRGDIGPNLTDKNWLIAKGTPDTLYQVVFNGSEENGMPAWSELISQDEIYQAVIYVNSLKNTFAKDGKEPEGELIED